MRTIIVIAALVFAFVGPAAAQGRNAPGDRALGSELNRDKAETRIERLRQDQRQNEQKQERASRAQKLPASGSTQKPR